MKKVAVDYKGKHFIIQDEDALYEGDITDPYVDVDGVIEHNLEEHVDACLYYGIPAYIGSDKKLKERIAGIEKSYNE